MLVVHVSLACFLYRKCRRRTCTVSSSFPMASGNWLVLQRLLMTVLFKLVLLVFRIAQRINWQLNGTERQRRETQHIYERCAHVLDVVYTHQFCESQSVAVDGDFICTHNRFENPQYIIDNDHCTLMEVNDEYAVFSEAKEKGVHLWKSEYSPFVRQAQILNSPRIIMVPLWAFYKMSETIGDPDAQIIFLFNTGRCGSTLLTQAMECTERCVALSEPDGTNLLAQRYLLYGDTPELRQLTRAVIRWLCRPYNTMGEPPLGYLIKLTATSDVIMPVLKELYPNCRYMFMYRDIIKMSKSLFRASQGLPLLRLIFNLGRLSGMVTEQLVNSMGLAGSELRVRLENDLTLGVVVTIVTTKVYQDMLRNGYDVCGLRYEDLVAKPLETCRAIMEFCRLPVSLAEKAIKGLEMDSQRNSPIAKSIVGTLAEPELTAEMKASFNESLRKFDQPLIGESNILPKTLTHC